MRLSVFRRSLRYKKEHALDLLVAQVTPGLARFLKLDKDPCQIVIELERLDE